MVPCSVVELRQYTLHPGRRDELVSLFERALVQGQEEAGIYVLGQFEDVARPDRFVWFRGFPSMSKRREALSRFYGGPVWHAHREAANATMAEWNDVLLLRPVQPTRGFPRRRAAAKHQTGTSRVLVRILHRAPGADDLVTFFRERVHPVLEGTGAMPVALLETKHAANDFPRLPVREDSDVVVSLSVVPDEEGLQEHLALLDADLDWCEYVAPALRSRLLAEPQQVVLRPTPRSGLW